MPFVESITITWHIDDVLSIAPDLTQEQASKVLVLAKHCHDSEIGINWDSLRVTADIVRNKRYE